MRRVQLAVLAVSCILGASLSSSSHARAWWRQVHASGCTMSPYSTNLGMVYTGSGYGYYNYSPNYVTIHCATENSQDHPKEAAYGLWVGVTDHRPDAEVTARACTQVGFGGAGGSCGPVSGSGVGATGGWVLYPSLSAWSGPGTALNDAYLAVTLPPYASGVGGSAFSSYEIGF
jgi:hypothetical protein